MPTCVYIYRTEGECIPSGDEVHPKYVDPPVIPGHEFIGEVVKLGPGKWDGRKEGGREGRKEGGREGGRERGKEGGREGRRVGD